MTEPNFAYDVHILFIMKFFALIFICLDIAPKRFLIATPEFFAAPAGAARGAKAE